MSGSARECLRSPLRDRSPAAKVTNDRQHRNQGIGRSRAVTPHRKRDGSVDQASVTGWSHARALSSNLSLLLRGRRLSMALRSLRGKTPDGSWGLRHVIGAGRSFRGVT